MAFDNNGIQPTIPLTTAGDGGGGFGGNGFGGLWGIIVLFFVVALLGGNGFGWGNNGGGSGAQPNYVLTSDFSNLERKMDIIQGDNCTNFAAVQAALANLSGSMMTTMHDGFSAAELAASNRMATLTAQIYDQNMRTMQTACDQARQIEGGFNQVNYNMAQQGCETRTLIQSTTRDIIDNANSNTRAVLDAMREQELNALRAQLSDRDRQITALQFAASQGVQTNQIQNYVQGQFAYYNPRPQPAFVVAPPFQYGGPGAGFNAGFGAGFGAGLAA